MRKKSVFLIALLCMSFLLAACGNEKKQKAAMEASVENLFSDIQTGDFDSLDDNFTNMPGPLDQLLNRLSCDEESTYEIVSRLQEIVRFNMQRITCEIKPDESTYDKESGTGQVHATISYCNLKDTAIGASEEILKEIISSGLKKLFMEKDSKWKQTLKERALDTTLNSIISHEPEMLTTDITFYMVEQDGVWLIQDTDSPLLDVLSGNISNPLNKILDFLGIEES